MLSATSSLWLGLVRKARFFDVVEKNDGIYWLSRLTSDFLVVSVHVICIHVCDDVFCVLVCWKQQGGGHWLVSIRVQQRRNSVVWQMLVHSRTSEVWIWRGIWCEYMLCSLLCLNEVTTDINCYLWIFWTLIASVMVLIVQSYKGARRSKIWG